MSKGFSSKVLRTVNIALLPPMPSASARRAASENAGCFKIIRMLSRTFCAMLLMDSPRSKDYAHEVGQVPFRSGDNLRGQLSIPGPLSKDAADRRVLHRGRPGVPWLGTRTAGRMHRRGLAAGPAGASSGCREIPG